MIGDKSFAIEIILKTRENSSVARSTTDLSKAPSVFQVEIDEVPVPKEPRKTDTGERQRSVKKFCPNPSPGFRPRLQGANQANQRTHRSKNARSFDEIEDWIAAAAQICEIICACVPS